MTTTHPMFIVLFKDEDPYTKEINEELTRWAREQNVIMAEKLPELPPIHWSTSDVIDTINRIGGDD